MTNNEKLINRPEYIKKLNQWKNQEDLVKIITGVRRCGKSKLFVIFQKSIVSFFFKVKCFNIVQNIFYF